MEKKYYVDTAIWRDLHENRTDKFRPLGEWAFEFFKKVLDDEKKILYSDLVIKELSGHFDIKTINNILNIASGRELLEKVEINKNQTKEAFEIKKKLNVPFGDALHAILARDNNAVMVTRDKHFLEFDFVAVKKPEELI